MIALVTHMHEHLVMTEQSQSSNPILIPADFCCPLSFELMTDPVIVASGKTYERAFIRKWIDLGLIVCPKTRQTPAHTTLIPNYTVNALVASWCESNNVKIPYPVKSMSLNQPRSPLAHAENIASKDPYISFVNQAAANLWNFITSPFFFREFPALCSCKWACVGYSDIDSLRAEKMSSWLSSFVPPFLTMESSLPTSSAAFCDFVCSLH
ncbi:ARM repeat superfamily protein [Actinidia rufa]|uniref:ARM repeat superfamily protein n=1 Tax=Actinidia rufa TaxID=165716 RepID=A0A7J0F4Y2_9ERIC|nr:ARM repeat superfamily protein [Actinidia rufa]